MFSPSLKHVVIGSQGKDLRGSQREDVTGRGCRPRQGVKGMRCPRVSKVSKIYNATEGVTRGAEIVSLGWSAETALEGEPNGGRGGF
eukprot:800847-Prorocentrum_minimum.AAC.1